MTRLLALSLGALLGAVGVAYGQDEPPIDPQSIVAGFTVDSRPEINVFDGETGDVTAEFFPYGGPREHRPTGVTVAAGDINCDGVPDIVVGAGPGSPPLVKVFNGQTLAAIHSFFAYPPNFRGGVYVAVGDVNGDGTPDIITAPGAGAPPQVKVFNGLTGEQLDSFFAYPPGFTGGVRVAVGDVNGDDVAEIITGPGPGARPLINVFDGQTLDRLASFHAFPTGFVGGVYVAAGDVNRDDKDDIVVGAGPGAPPLVRVFDFEAESILHTFLAFPPNFMGGVRVATGDVNQDGVVDDIIVGTGPGGPPHVKVFEGETLEELHSFHGPGRRAHGGVFVAGARAACLP